MNQLNINQNIANNGNALSECYTEDGVAYQGDDVPGSQLVGDNNRTDVEDCRSFCQGQSGAAFFTFNEKRKSCGCRATKGESENARGTHSGIIFDQPKLYRWNG